MVRLSGQLKGIFIKASFNEVTATDLLKITDSAPRSILKALSTFDDATLDKLTTDQVLALYEIVSYIESFDESIMYLPYSFTPPQVDIAGSTFEKCELAKLHAQSKVPYYILYPQLVGIYLGQDHLRGCAVECLAKGAIIFQELGNFLDRFKDLGGDEPNEDQQEAGIESLHSFGSYGIVETIAMRYNCKPYDVYSWDAEEVYMDMLYQQAKSRYQDNLRDIEKRKNKSK